MKRADVPKPVLAAVEAKFPNARLTHFAKEVEDGKTLYEVVLTVGTSHAEISVSPDGKIVSEETTITMNELPAAAQKSLAASKYGTAKVLRVERVMDAAKPDATTFELMVEQAGKQHELAFDEAGKLARVE
ncbi:MAG TPA: PepSY-like domain-containing protein [Polyangiales bacterium]